MKVMRTPRSLDIDITNRCNLRCTYCYHFTSAGDVGQDLPPGEWHQFFHEMNTCGVMKVCIQGGEPFFRKDLPELIEGVVKNRMRFTLLSNGTLITDEIASFLASTRRCEGVQVSLDGSRSRIHDTFRGHGSFLSAVQGIEHLRKHCVPVSVRVTVHRENVHDLEETARFLLEDLGLPSFSTNSAGFMGLCKQNARKVQLSVSERITAAQTLLELMRKYHGRIHAMAGPLAEAKNWSKMHRAYQEGRKNLSGGGYLSACGGVMNKMAVRADGIIVPCIQLSHIELGRINRDNLKEVWQTHPQLMRLRKRHMIPLTDFTFCRGCDYIPYCTGNCPALASTILGEENHPSPDACLRTFLQQGGRLPDEKEYIFTG
jgi:SynChlorMet cassette radical SAM/SPASM protein ScmE